MTPVLLLLLLVVGSTGLAFGAGSPRKAAVITDVDGTLFSFAGRDLSEGNRAALNTCMDKLGVDVCVATGRIPGPWFTALKKQLPGLGPSVFGNGALLMSADGEILWESKLPSDIVSVVLDYTSGGKDGKEGGRLCVLAATRWQDEEVGASAIRYCELSPMGEPSEITALIQRAGEPDAVLLPSLDGFEARDVLKFVIWTVPGQEGWAKMPSTVAALKAALGGTGATILDHGERWCEILPPGVNKGSGVLRLLDKLGVAPTDAIACGDAENDVEMLQVVGVGCAMANAQPAALQAADVVVASNADDGVADAVRRFVLPLEDAAEEELSTGEDDSDQMAASDEAAGLSLEFFTLDMCPYAQRCWVVLEELDVPYTSRTVNLRGDDKEKEWYLSNVNPRGKVPALRDNGSGNEGLTIYESLIINEYLCEAYANRGGSRLLPPDPSLRARIRLWNEHLDTQLAPAHFTFLMSKDNDGSEAATSKRAALDTALAHYESSLVGPYLCGEAFTLADVAALPFFERLVFSLRHYKQLDALVAYPRTRAWMELAMSRPSFAATKRPEDKLVALYDRFLQVDYSFGGLNKN